MTGGNFRAVKVVVNRHSLTVSLSPERPYRYGSPVTRVPGNGEGLIEAINHVGSVIA